MGQNIALDFEAIKKDITSITAATEAILENLKTAKTKVEELSTSDGVKDVTVAAVAGRLNEQVKLLSEVPEMMQDLSRTLQKKSQELEDATGEATAAIANLGME